MGILVLYNHWDEIGFNYHPENDRTFWIFNFYGFIRIYYRYIDYFVIRNKDLYGFIIGVLVPKNLYI